MLSRCRNADSLCMCQMQLLQILLRPAAMFVCSLCALVPTYLMMLLEIVQLLVRALYFRCLIPCCVLFLCQSSPILLHVTRLTPGCQGSFCTCLLKFVLAVYAILRYSTAIVRIVCLCTFAQWQAKRCNYGLIHIRV